MPTLWGHVIICPVPQPNNQTVAVSWPGLDLADLGLVESGIMYKIHVDRGDW